MPIVVWSSADAGSAENRMRGSIDSTIIRWRRRCEARILEATRLQAVAARATGLHRGNSQPGDWHAWANGLTSPADVFVTGAWRIKDGSLTEL